MSTTSSLTTTSVSAEARSTKSKPVTIALWMAQALLAASFAAAAVQKIAGTPYMVHMFAEIGAGQWLRYAIAFVEIAGAVGLLVPRLCGLAALGLVALMVAASITNLLIHYNVAVPLSYLLVAGVIARGRWARTRRLLTISAPEEARS
jgi:uncharacterized membrane protein YphA (DoxX/SURF4 family)